eukprot:NODE_2769_length_1123_cov_36.922719_g2542_i0.p1 GENE.NODE_2769_length_1123_cov_36.922719_g2542_i0~~NODE_2769_length_1123_cov_36.922719_g2542_i0.p1  ORF type:complete len:332 (+),score=53.53 NODE_2769_length_1123_cov_36.922719_g2542_i0:52-1047(+)
MSVKRKILQIGTHSGTFHCDEALGCFILRQLPQFAGAVVVRTRDPAVLQGCDLVLDVGAVYDHAALRYDHHQRGFTEVLGEGFNTKLSSAGLIYKHYGREYLASKMGCAIEDPSVSALFKAVYQHFVEAVDAIDNGITQWDTTEPPRYLITTSLSSRVGRLNPGWNAGAVTDEQRDAAFMKAVDLVGKEFTECVNDYINSWLPARKHVTLAVNERFDVHCSGAIMLLRTGCPWAEHLDQIEAELGIGDQIKYCLFEDSGSSWRVRAVAARPGSFECRKPLPSAWCGVRDEQLSTLTGIPGCIFVHANGFIGGHQNRDGALAMAVKALEIKE